MGVGAPGEEGYYVPPTKGTSQTQVEITMHDCTATSIKITYAFNLKVFLYRWNLMYCRISSKSSA